MLCFNLERTDNYFQQAYDMEQWRIQDFRKGGAILFLLFNGKKGEPKKLLWLFLQCKNF